MRPLRKDRAALAGEASAAAAKVESSPPPIPDPAAGAFFDVDNTLMRGASIYYFARGLAARKMFGPMDLARMAWGQACYRMRGAENADHIDAAREAALAFVAGHRVSDIVSLCEEIYDDTMADRIWEGTRELAQRHLEAGQRVWLVTAIAGGTGRHHRQPARPHRGARHRCRVRRRRLHRAAGRRAAARRGEGGGGRGPGRARRPGPGPVLRLQRLRERPADAAPGRASHRGQPRCGAAGRGAGQPLARARLPVRPQGHPDRPAHRGGRRRRGRGHRGRAGPPAPPRRRTARTPGPASRRRGRARTADRPACAGWCPAPGRSGRRSPPGRPRCRAGNRRWGPAGRTR